EVKGYSGSSSSGTLLLDQRHWFLNGQRYISLGDQNVVTGTGYSQWTVGIEWRTETLNSSGGIISAVEQDWTQRAAVAWPAGGNWPQEQPANDNRVNETRHYLDNGTFAKTDIYYDNGNYPSANNISEVDEYDFDQSLKRRTTINYVTGSYQTDDSIHLL